MEQNEFAVLILSHGRPNNIHTIRSLETHGYTGPWHIIIDNEDKMADEYRKNYGSKVIVFDKIKYAKITDCGDNRPERNTVLFARNAAFDIAKGLGLQYFLVLDDDYSSWRFMLTSDGFYTDEKAGNLDIIFGAILEFYKTLSISSIAISQSGDFFGGRKGNISKNMTLLRKCMNSFFCSIQRPFKYVARMNDDVSTYLSLGATGNIFFTIPLLALHQASTQANAGGLTEMYLDAGTYVKSFYSVMYCPSCVKVADMGVSQRRLHHKTSWNNAVPKIVREDLKKHG